MNEKESPFWLYCQETNIPLLPLFLYQLAKVFLENQDKYSFAMDHIIKEQGVLSDDGEKWVDKHSGYTIKEIDFADDAGFNQGLGLLDIDYEIETPMETIVLSQELKIVHNVIDSMCYFMGIELSVQKDFIGRHVSNQLINFFTEQQYNQTKQSKKVPYIDFKYFNIVFLTLALLYISIQTTIPSIITKKTFPTCIKSFQGYPLTSKDNLDGIKYMSCIVSKIKSKSISPWNTLSRIKTQQQMEETLLQYIDAVVTEPDIETSLETKRKYLLENAEDSEEDEYNLKRWVLFLPPLYPFHIKDMEYLEIDSFEKSLVKSIREGNKDQLDKMNILISKNIFYSLKIDR